MSEVIKTLGPDSWGTVDITSIAGHPCGTAIQSNDGRKKSVI
jgi:muconolactone delta-isomerase